MRKNTYKPSFPASSHGSWTMLFSSLLSLFSMAAAQAQTSGHDGEKTQTPKLVIGITIDQLRGDYLQYCMSSFGEKGFKRLLNEGLVYQQVEFDYQNLSAASAIATIYTGTNPYYHGITGHSRYDWSTLSEIPILNDPDYIGNYTSETLSPKNLKSTTVADELKTATNGRGYVFSIAPNAVEAIVTGGHAANAAFWLEDYNGKWATTTYYKDIPWYVERYNLSESLDYRINDVVWTPASTGYDAFPFVNNGQTFKYYFYSKEKFRQVKTSPVINKEITDLADRFMQFEDFKSKVYPGLFSVTYFAGNYQETMNKAYSTEIQDTYCKLDKEIERLLESVDKHVGLQNTFIFLTSTGYFESEEGNPDIIKPVGKFYPNRCTALLNMYLMSVYGSGNWVLGYYRNHIFLNRKLIDDKQLSLADVQRKAAEFTIQFSGVQDVSTLIEMLYGNWNEGVVRFRNGNNKDISGDIIVELQPGWLLVDEKSSAPDKHIRNNAIVAPLIFLSHQVKPQRVNRIVKATQIAPTVTHVLRIRPPNAARELPLQEFILP